MTEDLEHVKDVLFEGLMRGTARLATGTETSAVSPAARRTALAHALNIARLVVNDWHACASATELQQWQAAQYRLIDAAIAFGAASCPHAE